MYGENSDHLRHNLGVLLREHRIQQRLGGAGSHTIPQTTTPEERAALGQQIRRYRQCILTWTLEAVHASQTPNPLEHPRQLRDPVDDLGRCIKRTLEAASIDLAHGEELTTPQAYPTIELWRLAARAAVLGEHDLPTSTQGAFTPAQRNAVLKDATDIVRGLLVLDRRYQGVPGWEPLRSRGRLSQAAETCALQTEQAELDYTVDRLGWQPPPNPFTPHPLTGLRGVIQAQRQLLTDLKALPTALSLRVVMESQRIIAHKISRRTHDPSPSLTAIATRWAVRERTYLSLVHATRDLVSIVGQQHATATANIAALRAERLPFVAQMNLTEVLALERLCSTVDQRIGAALEFGTSQRLYLLRVPKDVIDIERPGIVKGPKSHVVPFPSHLTNALLARMRAELGSRPGNPKPPARALQSRRDYETALQHHPGDPGSHQTL